MQGGEGHFKEAAGLGRAALAQHEKAMKGNTEPGEAVGETGSPI